MPEKFDRVLMEFCEKKKYGSLIELSWRKKNNKVSLLMEI
jgi:hypothetical protein